MKRLLCALIITLLPQPLLAAPSKGCVVLLHGLMRSARAMSPLEIATKEAGYYTVNIDYDSLKAPIEELAPQAIDQGLAECRQHHKQPIHFITHSLGGILLRYYLTKQQIPELGNSVMIAPPNGGSQVIDTLRHIPGIGYVVGDAGLQLGTDAQSLPGQLGPVDYPVGVIAGDRTINPLLSLTLPNPDDGKVSVASAKVAGMTDFIVLHHSHVFIMRADDTIAQSLHFIANRSFDHSNDTEE